MPNVYINWNERQYLIDKTNSDRTKIIWMYENGSISSFFYDKISIDESQSALSDVDTIGNLLEYEGLNSTRYIIAFVNNMIEVYLRAYYSGVFNTIGADWQEYYNKIIQIYSEKVINLFDLSGYAQTQTKIDLSSSAITVKVSFYNDTYSLVDSKSITVAETEIQPLNDYLYQLMVNTANIDLCSYLLVEYFNTAENKSELIDYNFYELDKFPDTIDLLMEYHTKEFKRGV